MKASRTAHMRALCVQSYDSGCTPALVELPVPACAPTEVRVRVLAAGISHVDLLVVAGSYQIRLQPPFIGGTEFSGIVDEVGGADTSDLRVGDRVCGTRPGAWAEFLCLPGNMLQALPQDAPALETAVLVAPYATALYGLDARARLGAGETLLVLGATGSVGYAAVQLGAFLGARVIALATGAHKHDIARRAGASHVVDGGGSWKDEVKALTGPTGVDVVFDTVGGDATDAAFRTLAWGGRHLMVGFAGGQIGQLKTNLAILKGASLVGVDYREAVQRDREKAAAVRNKVVALYRDGNIRPLVRAVLPLASFTKARQFVQDRATVGRVVLDFEVSAERLQIL